MKERLKKIAKWILYPLFYLFCLVLFGYLTFPFDRLKDRLIAEFDHTQRKKSASAAQKLEIDHLTSYWFSGVEAKGVRLIFPPDDPSAAGAGRGFAALSAAAAQASNEPPKPTVIAVDSAHGRVRILPLLIGRIKIDFVANAFGGEVEGTIPVGASSGPVEVAFNNLDIGLVEPLTDLIGLPVKGILAGKLELEASEGKFSKANGSLDISVTGASLGDGKTKFKGQVALPEARLGDITIAGTATEGALKITALSASGPDVELSGDGKLNVREPWNETTADLGLRFKFSDAYRDKNDETRSLLGAPNSNMPALIEIAEPKIKRAKRPDGFYGFHITGALKRLKFEPSTGDSGGARPVRGKGAEASPFALPNKRPSIPTPAAPARDDSAAPAPAAPAPAEEKPQADTPQPAPGGEGDAPAPADGPADR